MADTRRWGKSRQIRACGSVTILSGDCHRPPVSCLLWSVGSLKAILCGDYDAGAIHLERAIENGAGSSWLGANSEGCRGTVLPIGSAALLTIASPLLVTTTSRTSAAIERMQVFSASLLETLQGHGAAERSVRNERHFWATLSYVHHNPIRHGYTRRWREWPFSSAVEYVEQVGRTTAARIWKDYPLLEYGKGWDDPEL